MSSISPMAPPAPEPVTCFTQPLPSPVLHAHPGQGLRGPRTLSQMESQVSVLLEGTSSEEASLQECPGPVSCLLAARGGAEVLMRTRFLSFRSSSRMQTPGLVCLLYSELLGQALANKTKLVKSRVKAWGAWRKRMVHRGENVSRGWRG